MPSSVEIFNVTKFLPGQLTNTLASVIFKLCSSCSVCSGLINLDATWHQMRRKIRCDAPDRDRSRHCFGPAIEPESYQQREADPPESRSDRRNGFRLIDGRQKNIRST